MDSYPLSPYFGFVLHCNYLVHEISSHRNLLDDFQADGQMGFGDRLLSSKSFSILGLGKPQSENFKQIVTYDIATFKDKDFVDLGLGNSNQFHLTVALYQTAGADYRLAVDDPQNTKGFSQPFKVFDSNAKAFATFTSKPEEATDIFRDIQIYSVNYSSTSDPDMAKALILDKQHKTLWDISIDFSVNPPTCTEKLNVNPAEGDVNGVLVGNEPVAMALQRSATDSDAAKAYVLNAGDETVSVFTLDSTKLPALTATIPIKDVAPDKQLVFRPNTLVFQNGALVIGSRGIKAVIVVRSEALKKLTEDNKSTN